SDDEDEQLAHFLESEILSGICDQVSDEIGEIPMAKRRRHTGDGDDRFMVRIQTGILCQIPPELVLYILKFLSSEDLVSCSLVCRFLNFAASDESLWRRLYGIRWGLLPWKKPRECAWKKLYIQ
ncbi:hypothetical protein M569_10958, partial [Genlisea aurea]